MPREGDGMSGFLHLLRKDWRLNRAVVLTLVISMASIYAFGCADYYWVRHEAPMERWANGGYDATFGDNMAYCAFAGLFVTVLLAAAFGANAFATERRERWGDFLATIPASRGQIILSKLIVAVACVAVSVAVNSAVLAVTSNHSWRSMQLMRDSRQILFYWGGMAVGLFGIAWAMSLFISSAAIAAAISMGSLFAVGEVIYIFGWYDRMDQTDRSFTTTMSIAAGFAGVVCAIAASLHYLRRVRP
jgi:ABC-type transport system involved in multi-copper enzyme maturation permease subunit